MRHFLNAVNTQLSEMNRDYRICGTQSAPYLFGKLPDFTLTMPSRKIFQIAWTSRKGQWANDVATLFSRVPAGTGATWPPWIGKKNGPLKPVRGVLLSVFAHAAAFILITHLNFLPGYEPPHIAEAPEPTPIYLDLEALKALHILRSLPVIQPAGPGGVAGSSEQTVHVVLQAANVQHPKVTIVLNPLKPDNRRQAITQQIAPPDLKIQMEQKVPDIIMPESPTLTKPNVDMTMHQPNGAKISHDKPVDAPTIAANVSDLSFKVTPNIAKPNVDMTLRQPNGPAISQNHAVDAPLVAANAPELALKISPNVQQPQMPVSYFASSSMQAPHGNKSGGGASSSASANPSGDTSGGVIVMSVDPGTFSQLASLAQGNRFAAIAIAPAKEGLGSPGGSSNGEAGGGTGGPGNGGDTSSAVGPGHSGGGGGGAEGPLRATLSAVGGSGKTGGVDTNKLLGKVLPSTVYAVATPTKIRRPPLVVSTGPIGGGGLDVYGALPCGKVYTIFLPMPGKSWVLEYCAHQGGEIKSAQPTGGVVQMEVGLLPPSVDQQYDFHRLAVPEKDADKFIVLRGLIDKDGSISEVHVFQGVQPEMDAVAAVAFSNWKFKPAMRAALPVSVDVLVGIPVRVPAQTAETPGGGTQGN